MKMLFLKYKPLSVNKAFTGQRYKTPLYKVFVKAITDLLAYVAKPPKPPDTRLFAHYVWGFSNNQSDVDNPTKTFQDVLFDYWGLKNKDHRVRFMILEARKCEKNEEFIGFHVDNQDNLIEYVENLLEKLKSEQKPDTEFP